MSSYGKHDLSFHIFFPYIPFNIFYIPFHSFCFPWNILYSIPFHSMFSTYPKIRVNFSIFSFNFIIKLFQFIHKMNSSKSGKVKLQLKHITAQSYWWLNIIFYKNYLNIQNVTLCNIFCYTGWKYFLRLICFFQNSMPFFT